MKTNEFLFSPRYHLLRHVVYWLGYTVLWTSYWTMVKLTFVQNFYIMLIWLPAFMLFSYPVALLAVPHLLLKGRYLAFILFMIAWGYFGWTLNFYFRSYVFFPLTEWAHVWHGPSPKDPTSFLCLTTTAGCFNVSSLAKRWVKKQGQWMQAEQEKMIAQLQLLRAQLHPHFLFNTLNNIYSFALHNSGKTPGMILKLSSLLSYMLYECRTEEVLLEKEVEIMKNYIDLEKERYGDKIDISLNIEGDIQDQFIAPLLILPFLENAFKHGTSEQLDRPWMSVDIVVKDQCLTCKVVNSKNELVTIHEQGVGIANVKKRLAYLYPEKYELRLADEGNFFVVFMQVQLAPKQTRVIPLSQPVKHDNSYAHAVLANR